MDDLVALFAHETWSGRAGATQEQLLGVERALGVRLPEDLKTVFRQADGGKGYIGAGQAYLQRLSAAEIVEFHGHGFCAFPGVVLIGSDGSRESLALDYRADAERPRLATVDLTVADPQAAVVVFGSSFSDGITRLAAAGSVWDISGVGDHGVPR